MKFILVFSICSAITGYCENPMIVEKKYNSWAECVKGGGEIINITTDKFQERFNKEKLYINYFCNENNTNETPT